ncbi:hypothetical protein [Deinococcus irradiatisoli]|uniref:hypothetical protein n=1 Tax=Deinococcus irradiatisoli TaxID=2202254 RepID=UPI0015E83E27|nr:hypothetical protein [Deinococcus irradiatisoli]
MRRPGQEGGGSDTHRLQPLYEKALLDAQRPGNIGAGLKVLEALLNVAGFKPKDGAKA